MPINDSEYSEIKKRMMLRTLANDVLYSLPNIGFWVKDLNFNFMDISEKAANTLYGMSSNDCVGHNDFDIARLAGLELSIDMFAEVCRGSDLYMLENPINSKYGVTAFIELVTGVDGQKHIWRTIKGVYPEKVGSEKYLYGIAMFMDEIKGGYEEAYNWLHSKEIVHLEKLNEYLYRYK